MPVFSEEDFNSNDGMLTSVWGPCMWHSLHTISFNYPVEPDNKQRIRYYRFFLSIKDILPCKYCRDNYKQNLKLLNFSLKYFENRETLSKFVYELHELVNTNLEKKSNLSYNDVRERYENFRSRCLNDKEKKKRSDSKKELGCVNSLYGVKSKCVLSIVPVNKKCRTFNISKQCIIKKKN